MPGLTIYEQLWPQIPWRKPIRIQLFQRPEVVRYGCRLCIAAHGLKGSEVEDLWESEEEARPHVEACMG